MNESDLLTIVVGAATIVGAVLAFGLVLKSLLHVCEPNEVLVFSGRKHRTAEGSDIGYRIVRGGRAFRWPIVERVDRMDISLISVPMTVRGAYSEGGIPIDVDAVANVKVSSNDRWLGNAIERFLGRERREIAIVAKETLEGHLRGVVATMTPEEVNEDRLKFADRLLSEAGADLQKLGLQLDTLKIQAVSDHRNYLDSLGRTRIAEIVRAAEVAESDAVRHAEEIEAACKARGEVAQKRARAAVAQKANDVRRVRSEFEAQAKVAEERAEQHALLARVEAEKALQTLRAQLEELRLTADVTVVAEADRRAQQLRAAGQAAAIEEQGKATSAALALIADVWREGGEHALDAVVAQQLDAVLSQVAQNAAAMQPKEVHLVDDGTGNAIADYARAYPKTVVSMLDGLTETLGVDFRRVLRPGKPAVPRTQSEIPLALDTAADDPNPEATEAA